MGGSIPVFFFEESPIISTNDYKPSKINVKNGQPVPLDQAMIPPLYDPLVDFLCQIRRKVYPGP